MTVSFFLKFIIEFQNFYHNSKMQFYILSYIVVLASLYITFLSCWAYMHCVFSCLLLPVAGAHQESLGPFYHFPWWRHAPNGERHAPNRSWGKHASLHQSLDTENAPPVYMLNRNIYKCDVHIYSEISEQDSKSFVWCTVRK